MRLARTSIIIFVLVALVFALYPRDMNGSGTIYVCQGIKLRMTSDEVRLNVRDSVLRIAEKPEYYCMGRVKTVGMMCYEMYRDERPVIREVIFRECKGRSSVYGIACSEWSRAFSELDGKESVKIKIDDATRTHVFVRCDYEYEQFPGGDSALNVFVNQHFAFPDSVKGECIGGFLYVNFAIDTAGIVSSVRVHHNSVSEYYEGEISRVLSLAPPWKPRTCRGNKAVGNQSFKVVFTNRDASCKQMKIVLENQFDAIRQ